MFYLGTCLFLILLSSLVSSINVHTDTPFCEICLCTSLPNESPTINCIAEEVPNIYDVRLWYDRDDNPYPVKMLILQYNKLNVLNTPFPFSNLKELDLSRNVIKSLGIGIFAQLQEMTTLILSHNKIDYLNPHTFQGKYKESLYFPLRALRKLDLEYNELHTLNADTFEHIDELEELSLSHNPFKTIDAQTVQAITSLAFLKILNLAYAQLKTLPNYFLHAPKRLNILDLSGNLFEAVPSALQHSTVTTLFFSNNLLKELQSYSFSSSTLTRLYLERMPFLSRIAKMAFADSPKINELYLSNNRKLSVIEKDAFLLNNEQHLPITKLFLRDSNLSSMDKTLVRGWTHLEQLDLTGNPWTCNCSVQWLINISRSRTSLNELRCVNPFELQGVMFYELELNQTQVPCTKYVRRNLNRYIVILLILSSLLVVLVFMIVFFIRKKRRTILGPNFHLVGVTH